MAKCPKCGRKLTLFDWKPNCPDCGVNLVYYGMEERLLAEADAVFSEFADPAPAHEITPLLKYARKLADTGALSLFASLAT